MKEIILKDANGAEKRKKKIKYDPWWINLMKKLKEITEE